MFSIVSAHGPVNRDDGNAIRELYEAVSRRRHLDPSGAAPISLLFGKFLRHLELCDMPHENKSTYVKFEKTKLHPAVRVILSFPECRKPQ